MKKIVSLLVVALVATFALAGCGGSSSDASKPTRKFTLTVLAASSLTETFDKLAKEYEAKHPAAKVKLVYDSSATLAEQAEQGAPGDVLATADKPTMDGAQAKNGVQGTPTEFATNTVTLAVPSANPGKISTFADLNKSSVKYVVCVKTAPCGAASDALLKSNKITRKPVSEEVDVKSVLAKVVANEADAGMVYKSDVQASGDKVKGIEVPGAAANPNTYWVAQTANVRRHRLAQAWIDLMMSAKGQKIFTDAGFGSP